MHACMPELSVVSNDGRSERNVVRVSKYRYMTEYKHLQDMTGENITEKKSNTEKVQVCASLDLHLTITRIAQRFLEKEWGQCRM